MAQNLKSSRRTAAFAVCRLKSWKSGSAPEAFDAQPGQDPTWGSSGTLCPYRRRHSVYPSVPPRPPGRPDRSKLVSRKIPGEAQRVDTTTSFSGPDWEYQPGESTVLSKEITPPLLPQPRWIVCDPDACRGFVILTGHGLFSRFFRISLSTRRVL